MKAYGVAWKRIKTDADSLLSKIADARERHEVISEAWLLGDERLQKLLDQVEAESARLSSLTSGVIDKQQAAAIDQALGNSVDLLREALGETPPGLSVSFTRLPREAFEELVGTLSDGSPLKKLLDELGPIASRRIREGLIAGLASGASIPKIARGIRFAFGDSLTDALTISRTAIIRAYLEASHRTYKANSDVVAGWIWHSALGARTCASCWGMHGTFHPLTDTLNDHWNGRCSAIPKTRSWAELGFPDFPDTSVDILSGEQLFAELSADEQRSILGQSAYRAYAAGAVRLTDFVGERTDPVWGVMRYRRSLRDVLGDRAEDFYSTRVVPTSRAA